MGALKNFLEEKSFFAFDVDMTDVFEAWTEDIDPEVAHDLAEAGLLAEYWAESLICLGHDEDYALLGGEPAGYPVDIAGALEALGIRPVSDEADRYLWDDLVSHGHVEVFPVDGSTVAYYAHPMMEPGVPWHLQRSHPHGPCGVAHYGQGPVPY